jgi:hypothetical protein
MTDIPGGWATGAPAAAAALRAELGVTRRVGAHPPPAAVAAAALPPTPMRALPRPGDAAPRAATATSASKPMLTVAELREALAACDRTLANRCVCLSLMCAC